MKPDGLNPEIGDIFPQMSYELARVTTLDRIANASFPSKVDLSNEISSPAHGLVVREEGKPILVCTPEHHQLLYLINSMKLLDVDSDRILVNLDDHDDYRMNDDTRVNAGNWGAAGGEQKYWGTFIHVSARNALATTENIPEIHQLALFNPEETAKQLIRLIGSRKYVLTIDADEFAQHTRKLTRFEINKFKLFFKTLFKEGIKPQIIHYTPSPIFCSYEDAKTLWDILREILQD